MSRHSLTLTFGEREMRLPGTLAFLPSSNTYSESVRVCGPCMVQICLVVYRFQIYIILGGR